MEKYDFIIIGAGYSGLSFAALMAKHGKKVLIIEKNNYIGGRNATRKAGEWGWHDSDDLVSFGPHIFPAKGYSEYLMDQLGIKKSLRLHKLKPPFLLVKDKLIDPSCSIFNLYSHARIFFKLDFLDFKEKIGLLKMLMTALFSSNNELIEKYSSMSCEKFLKTICLCSEDAKTFISGIIGGYSFNDDLCSCPALDLLINVKLALRGIIRKGAMMYHVGKGYGDVIEELRKVIEKNKGEIMTGMPYEKILVKGNKAYGISISGQKIRSDNVVVSIDDKRFSELLKKSKISSSFLKRQLCIKEAKVMDLIVKAKRKIHGWDTSWVSCLMDRRWEFVIIDENPLVRKKPIYHICMISHNKKVNVSSFMSIISKELKERFNFDIKKDIIWKKIVELQGYGSERNIKIPFNRRIGPKTPIKGLYCIGDSYKALTTGTDGCSYSVMELAEEFIEEDFKLDKRLSPISA